MMNTNMNINEMEAAGKAAVQSFMCGIKAKLHRTKTVEDAVNDADQARTNVLGHFKELLTTYDALGITKLSRAYMKCLDSATIDGKTSVLKLGHALSKATDEVIEGLENDVQWCIDNDVPATKALQMLAAVRCLKNNGNGNSVPGALVRSLLYIVQATVNKVSKWLGLQSEGTIWGALGKALKCFVDLAKVGVTIARRVIQGVSCYVVAGATKLGQLFMRAFYICVGVLSTWSANRNSNIDPAVEVAAEELYEEYCEEFEDFDQDYFGTDPDDEEENVEEEPKNKGFFGRFFRK